MEKVNLAQKFALFDELWSPKLIGELNGQQIKIAKIQGEFVWHHHEAEDEFFLVVQGRMTIKLPDRDVQLEEGEFFIVKIRSIDVQTCNTNQNNTAPFSGHAGCLCQWLFGIR